MDSAVLAEVIGIIALALLCLVSALSSWDTRRRMITVFGENPGPAQLTQRGYYVRLPDQASPAVPLSSSGAAPGGSGAPALAPAVEPAAEPGAPSASPSEEPAPETKPKPGTVPSSRRRPAVTARTDLATRARDLESADDAESDDDATTVLEPPTAEELAKDKQARSGRTNTLVSEFPGVPSSPRPAPDVKVVRAATLSKPGDTSAPAAKR